VAIAHRHEGQILLGFLLARSGELIDGTGLRGLRSLAAGVGIHFGIEDEDVDIRFVGQDVIQAAVADIEAPAIAADDPNALVEEIAVVFFEFLDRAFFEARPL
jgi:hypothetical protein